MNIAKGELNKIIEKHKKWLQREEGGIRADLRCADLIDANLRNAILRGADLRGADLGRADLRCADLRGADLRCADLRCADLRDANLRDADLRCADLRGAKNVPYIPMNCPDYGSFIGWKKAGQYIVKLQIPDTALRSSATGRKCRCNEAIVLAIENYAGTALELTEIASDYDSEFIYRVGDTVKVENFDKNRFNECAPGIHFFINRQEAVLY